MANLGLRYPSILKEIRDLQLSVDLMKLGARIQMIESLVNISYLRLCRLYNEVCGKSPPKGMFPYSPDWFMLWRPRIHSSLWMNIFERLKGDDDETSKLIRAHKMYLRHCAKHEATPILSITRAWIMLALFRDRTFELKACNECGNRTLVYRMDLNDGFVCGVCKPPSRAGMKRKAHGIVGMNNLEIENVKRLAGRSNADSDGRRGTGADALRPEVASTGLGAGLATPG